MTLEEYNKQRPNETRIELKSSFLRYKEENGEVKVFIHRKSSSGHEELPLGYILGSNALIFK